MNDYFFTFGQRYRSFRHQCGGHPDGWIRVTASSENKARTILTQKCGPHWSGQYTAEEFDRDIYPMGEIKHFTEGEDGAD